MMMMMMKIKFA